MSRSHSVRRERWRRGWSWCPNRCLWGWRRATSPQSHRQTTPADFSTSQTALNKTGDENRTSRVRPWGWRKHCPLRCRLTVVHNSLWSRGHQGQYYEELYAVQNMDVCTPEAVAGHSARLPGSPHCHPPSGSKEACRSIHRLYLCGRGNGPTLSGRHRRTYGGSDALTTPTRQVHHATTRMHGRHHHGTSRHGCGSSEALPLATAWEEEGRRRRNGELHRTSPAGRTRCVPSFLISVPSFSSGNQHAGKTDAVGRLHCSAPRHSATHSLKEQEDPTASC